MIFPFQLTKPRLAGKPGDNTETQIDADETKHKRDIAKPEKKLYDKKLLLPQLKSCLGMPANKVDNTLITTSPKTSKRNYVKT